MPSRTISQTPERWAKIQQIFLAAGELDAGERDQWIAQACGDDDNLRREVHALLAASGESRDPISDVIGLVAQDAAHRNSPHAPGDQIGHYRLVRAIGQGGMGSVYLAQRSDEQFEQKVAIKLIHAGMMNSELLLRFRSERQILANLQHPNIARLLDGGNTQHGVPYLVMEYIDGEPLFDYCNNRKLSVPERLALFRDVCAAVHYAHQNLVVHRDLKPSNILVAADGSPRLLDFGIAKLLGDSGQQTQALTHADMRLLTPAHASPEQMRGGTITTASDVYALGVLLYTLLSGAPPYRLENAGPRMMEELICETQPVPPSDAVARDEPPPPSEKAGGEGSPAGTHGARGSTPERLRRELRGDLDNIVLMAMRKEPERRYPSVRALSDDIERYLRRQPVVACPDTLRYRVSRFASRHRAGLAGGVFVTLLIAALVSFYTVRLSAERDRARQQANRAEQVSRFLTNVFELPNPSQAVGETITAREMLSRGAARAQSELADQPDIQAALMGTIAQVYEGIGLYDDAVRLGRQVLQTRLDLYGPDDPRVADSQVVLALAVQELGDLEAADALLTDAVRVKRATVDERDPSLAETINELGHNTYLAGDYPAARAFYEEARALFENTGNPISGGYFDVISNLAQVHEIQGDFEAAEAFYRQALAYHTETSPAAHPSRLITLHNLAVVLQQQGKFDEAASAYQESLDLERKSLGNDHPALGAGMANLGRLYHEQGMLDQAETYYRRALEHTTRTRGAEHSFVAYDKVNLATLLADRQDAGAGDLFNEALALYSRTLDPNHPYVASARVSYARYLVQTGHFEAARDSARQALAICDEALPADHWLASTGRSVLGAALMALGKLDEAAPLLRQSVPELQQSRGDSDQRTRRARERLAQYYDEVGDAAAATRTRTIPQ